MREVSARGDALALDVNTGTEASPVWTAVSGITEMNRPKIESKDVEDTDFEDDAWSGGQTVLRAWTLEATVRRKVTSEGAYDVGQEYLRVRSEGIGADNMAQVRVYDLLDGSTYAKSGWARVGWEDTDGKAESTAKAKISLTGNGSLDNITNPNNT